MDKNAQRAKKRKIISIIEMVLWIIGTIILIDIEIIFIIKEQQLKSILLILIMIAICACSAFISFREMRSVKDDSSRFDE